MYDQLAKGAAVGVGYGTASNYAEPGQPLSGKIANALDNAQLILARLTSVADRTFGSVPTPAETNVSQTLNTTDRTMDQLTDMLVRIAQVSARLESGL